MPSTPLHTILWFHVTSVYTCISCWWGHVSSLTVIRSFFCRRRRHNDHHTGTHHACHLLFSEMRILLQQRSTITSTWRSKSRIMKTSRLSPQIEVYYSLITSSLQSWHADFTGVTNQALSEELSKMKITHSEKCDSFTSLDKRREEIRTQLVSLQSEKVLLSQPTLPPVTFFAVNFAGSGVLEAWDRRKREKASLSRSSRGQKGPSRTWGKNCHPLVADKCNSEWPEGFRGHQQHKDWSPTKRDQKGRHGHHASRFWLLADAIHDVFLSWRLWRELRATKMQIRRDSFQSWWARLIEREHDLTWTHSWQWCVSS